MGRRHVVSVNIGNYTGSTARPLFFINDTWGGATVTDVQIIGDGAGTAITLQLITMTNVGTPAVNGTIGAFGGTIVYAEGVKFAATVSTAWVDGGSQVGVSQASGTAPTNAFLAITYEEGR